MGLGCSFAARKPMTLLPKRELSSKKAEAGLANPPLKVTIDLWDPHPCGFGIILGNRGP